MKYGYFDDANREYVITTPRTPLPWINYLGCNDFFSLVSNTCGGYSFYKDAKLLRITRYRYNDIPYDTNGKYYYIKDGDTVWNPGWKPTQTELDSYECRHGIGYSRFRSSENGVKADLLAFVPMDATCEINSLTLTNDTDQEKQLKLFSYVEFCLWNAMDDMTNFQRNLSIGEVEVVGSTIYHKTEYRERRNHFAYFSVNADAADFDTSRDSFIGAYREYSNPAAVEAGACENSMASGWSPISRPSSRCNTCSGRIEELRICTRLRRKPERPEVGKTGRDQQKTGTGTSLPLPDSAAGRKSIRRAERLLGSSAFQIRCFASADEKVNRIVNISATQVSDPSVTFNMSRSASYYESGTGRGMGFRDSCQDLLGFVHLIPGARKRAYHRYPPPPSSRTAVPITSISRSPKRATWISEVVTNDDPLWLIAGTSAYIKETGELLHS